MKTLKEIEQEFDDNFVHMGLLNDMHNRPPLYETKTEDINHFKQFYRQAIKEILEGLVKDLDVSGGGSGRRLLVQLKERIAQIIK